jgi:photosystem II stability/assembly factor-like uncharacterized protein
MFEHLDDPVPVPPGDRQLARVLRRARVIRARRRVGAVAAACLLVAGATVGVLVSRQSTTRLNSVQLDYQFNATRGPLSVGSPVPTTALINVVFAGPQDGYALVAHRGRAVLAITTDGGATWKVQNSTLPPGYGESNNYPGQIEFIGTHGYLWGGTQTDDGVEPLWVTDDGGLTWDRAVIGPDVFDVSGIGANVWAIAGDCGQPSPLTCALTLETSDDWGATWQTQDGAPFDNVSDASAVSDPVELARITLSRSYVLTSSLPDALGPNIALLFTANGGQTWQDVAVPCPSAFDLGSEIAASGTDDLWFLCGSQASGGSQSKELYRSSDGGANWALTASATGVGSSGPAVDTLPLDGYVAPFSIGHKNLAVANPTTAWLKPSGASMYKTTTGGHTWASIPDLDAAGFAGSGQGNITFISATQGWLCAYGLGLWHTTNGVTWSPLGQ